MAVHTRAATQQRASGRTTTSGSNNSKGTLNHNNVSAGNITKARNNRKPLLRSVRQGYLAAKCVEGKSVRGQKKSRGSCLNVQRSELNLIDGPHATHKESARARRAPRKGLLRTSVEVLNTCVSVAKKKKTTGTVGPVKVFKSDGIHVPITCSNNSQEDPDGPSDLNDDDVCNEPGRYTNITDALGVSNSRRLCTPSNGGSCNNNTDNLDAVNVTRCQPSVFKVTTTSHNLPRVDSNKRRKVFRQNLLDEANVQFRRRANNSGNNISTPQVVDTLSDLKRSSRSGSSPNSCPEPLLSKNQSGEIVRCKKSGKMFQYSPNLNIPTRTTSTLTPTMLRNIQDSFLEYDNEVQPPLEHQMAAGFAPPPVSLQQFNPNGPTQNNSGTLTLVGDSQRENSALDDNAINSLHKESRDNIEVKKEIIEEDAGWVETPWTNARALATTVISSSADEVTNTSVSNFQQTHLDFTQTSDIIRTPITSSSVGSLAIPVGPQICNGMAADGGKGSDSNSCGSLGRDISGVVSSASGHGKTSRRKAKDEGLPPEEEERRRQRREKNKLAAARCRQRRVDQTNQLQLKVDALEDTQKELLETIDSLKQTKKELERRFQQHACIQQRQDRVPVTSAPGMSGSVPMSVVCLKDNSNNHSSVAQNEATSYLDPSCSSSLAPTTDTLTSTHQTDSAQVKVIVCGKDVQENTGASYNQPQPTEKRARPNSLNVNVFEQTGVPIQTPSADLLIQRFGYITPIAGMYSFDGLIESTGLTPGATPVATPVAFSSSCTTQQQRSNHGDSLQTPDNPRKLVTL